MKRHSQTHLTTFDSSMFGLKNKFEKMDLR